MKDYPFFLREIHKTNFKIWFKFIQNDWLETEFQYGIKSILDDYKTDEEN